MLCIDSKTASLGLQKVSRVECGAQDQFELFENTLNARMVQLKI
jgi:hypothetical protein